MEALLADRGAVLWAAGDTFAGRIESSLASIAATIREKQEESEAAPRGHSVPRLTGWSGSPSIWMTDDLAFFDLSPSE